MFWWQILLVIIMFIIVGLVFGYFLSYIIIAQIMKRPFLEKFAPAIIFRRSRESTPKRQLSGEAPTKPAAVLEAKTTLSIEQSPQSEVPVAQPSASSQEEVTSGAAGEGILVGYALMSEVKNNNKIASRAQSGDLKSFSTKVWESTSQELLNLPEEIKQELSQAYVDMRLANSIVWLAIELKRRSPHLDDNYSKLCDNISARLNSIIPVLEKR